MVGTSSLKSVAKKRPTRGPRSSVRVATSRAVACSELEPSSERRGTGNRYAAQKTITSGASALKSVAEQYHMGLRRSHMRRPAKGSAPAIPKLSWGNRKIHRTSDMCPSGSSAPARSGGVRGRVIGTTRAAQVRAAPARERVQIARPRKWSPHAAPERRR